MIETRKRKTEWRQLGRIFITFAKIGPVTFGGGYAMVPMIVREAVDKRRWAAKEEMADLLAVAGSAPGALGINAAYCVGYRVAGLSGAVAAFMGVLLPTFAIALALSASYFFLQHNQTIHAAFEGIRPAVVALIVYAAYMMSKSSIIDRTSLAIAVAALGLLLLLNVHPLWLMLASPLAGIALAEAKRRLGYPEPAAKPSAEPEYTYQDYFIGDGI